MNEFDREIEAALRRRAESVQSHPLGFGDVSRRIVRRRRRTASMAAAAVSLPALIGVGWAVTRPEPAGQVVGAPDSAVAPTTTVSASADAPTMWACTGPVPQTTTLDGDQWSYFEYCETIVFSATTATTVEMPMPTTTVSAIDLAAMLDQVVFVDANGGLDVAGEVTARLGLPPRHLLQATRPVEQTMVMPTGADVSVAYAVIGQLGIGGFDTWTPDLIDGELPDGIAVVVVIGRDWPASAPPPQTTILCTPSTSESIVSTTTSLLDTADPTSTLAAGEIPCP